MIAKTLFHCTGLLALASTAQLSAAQTAQCLTEPEMRGLVTYAMPTLADTLVQRCKASLPAGSYLNTRGPGLVTSLRAGQSAAWPTAREALIKVSGRDEDSNQMLRTMPESVVSPILEQMIGDRFGETLEPKTCKDIDRVLTPLAPLPAPNLVEAVTQVAMIAARKSKDLPSCPAA